MRKLRNRKTDEAKTRENSRNIKEKTDNRLRHRCGPRDYMVNVIVIVMLVVVIEVIFVIIPSVFIVVVVVLIVFVVDVVVVVMIMV